MALQIIDILCEKCTNLQMKNKTKHTDDVTSCVFSPGKMWRQRSVVQASQGDGRPCSSQMEQWKPCPVRPCYRWQYSPWSECRVEVRHLIITL